MTDDDTTSRPHDSVGSSDSVSEADALAGLRARQRRSVRRFLVVVLAVVVGLSGLNLLLANESGCDRIPGVRSGLCILPMAERGAAPVQRAPAVRGDEELSVADHLGQVVVVNFWAAWCGPCRAEQPVLNEAHLLLAGGDVAFLGVAIQDSLVNQRAHLDEFEVPYPSIFDPANAYAATWGGIGARSIPTTLLLDRQGRVAVRIFGDIRDPVELLALTNRLLAEPSAPPEA